MPAESTYPHGEVFLDARGQGRALRLTWHREAEVVVLSLWRERICAGTFRLSTADVNEFVDALVDGLSDLPADDETASPDVRPRHAAPHTGAIDVTPPPPAQPPQAPALLAATPAGPADDDRGFVEWALGRDTA